MQFTNSVQFAYSVVHVCEKMDFRERCISAVLLKFDFKILEIHVQHVLGRPTTTTAMRTVCERRLEWILATL